MGRMWPAIMVLHLCVLAVGTNAHRPKVNRYHDRDNCLKEACTLPTCWAHNMYDLCQFDLQLFDSCVVDQCRNKCTGYMSWNLQCPLTLELISMLCGFQCRRICPKVSHGLCPAQPTTKPTLVKGFADRDISSTRHDSRSTGWALRHHQGSLMRRRRLLAEAVTGSVRQLSCNRLHITDFAMPASESVCAEPCVMPVCPRPARSMSRSLSGTVRTRALRENTFCKIAVAPYMNCLARKCQASCSGYTDWSNRCQFALNVTQMLCDIDCGLRCAD